MNNFKALCIKLREQDHTLPEIMKITGRSKTSIYFHIKNVQLSKEKQNKITEANRDRIVSFALSKKGKSLREFKKFNNWNESLVSLVAHLIFDGEIRHNSCTYNNRNNALLEKVKCAMSVIYEYEPNFYQNKITGVKRISYHNVALAAYINQKSGKLIANVQDFSKPLKREFVRAFFDDEGCMDFRPKENRRAVRGYQKNTKILILIKNLLEDFRITSKVVKPNEIVINGKENLKRFRDEINFSPGVKINGKRSNSSWKKSLEKRVLLDRAIQSFKI